jgi:peptidoglycan-associated lipoprotein
MKVSLYILLISFLGASCSKDSTSAPEPVSAGSEEQKPDAPTEPEAEEITFNPERVHFDFDKYNVKPEFESGLQQLSEVLKNKNLNLTIEGHCDERGTTEYNLGLGNRRADSVKQYLIALGVSEQQINTVSFGEERPLVSEKNLEAYSSNRRSELLLKK